MIEIIDRLKTRGVLLNPPLDLPNPEWLEFVERTKIFEGLAEVYGCFNGFLENSADQKSQISFWPVSKILCNQPFESSSEIVFGDLLIESDFVLLNLDGQIKLKYEDRLLGASVFDFLDSLSHGKFDFVKD
jgi:hypothetical protein